MNKKHPWIWLGALVCASVVFPSHAAAPKKRGGVDTSSLPEPAGRPVKYFGDVHPLLAEHCLSCHGADKQKGGLRLDSREAALKGGSSYGPAIIPGNSAESPFIQFIAHLEPDMEMPPAEEMLTEDQVAVLRAWIDQGAKWPAKAGVAEGGESTLGNQELFFKKAATHWAFQPVPALAAAQLADGPARIDALVAAKLGEKNLARSPRADARTLVRRVHFDLTGLPPAPEEVERFSADFAKDADAAVAALVDGLLASPHFGERWGRYWLDLARYADTQDFRAQQDLRYPFAWTYRDYVVSAFNSDKPYDRFLQEQIAADHLGLEKDDPTLAALGFMTVGPRFRGRVDEIINDRIDVVTRGLMGMTVACARCHDHKYDPIPTADFYAMYGVFASTQDAEELPEIALKQAEPTPEQRADYEAKKGAAKQALEAFVLDLKDKAVADVLAKPELYFDALCQMEIRKTADVRKLITGNKMMETALTPISRQWSELRRREEWLASQVLGPLARVASASADRKAGIIEGILETGRVPGSRAAVQPALLAALRAAKPQDEEALVKAYGKVLAEAVKKPKGPLGEVLAAFKDKGGWLDFPLDSVEGAYRLLGKGRADLNKLYSAVSEVEATHPGAPPRAMAVADRAKPVTQAIFVRGDPQRKGDTVERRFLEVLDPSKKAYPADRSGRRELAEQITARDNPLTGRVWANHVWRHLLGVPLVKTVGDFGLQAEPPSHPELLDWLAAALMDRGWSTKQLIRDVMLSVTYQQSSADRPEAAAVDAGNALLWRANRRRMDFEAMRDAMLATSGQLQLTLGGRAESLSVEPFSGRRTLYGYVDRVNLDPLFTTFDFPSPDIASPERSETLVPQQALFALNDGFIVSQARALARRAREAAGTSESGMVDWLYRRVFYRQPTGAELALAQGFLKETAGLSGASARGSWLYGYGSADPAVPRAQTFKRLPYFDPATKRYQGGRVYPHPDLSHVSLSAAGGHPGRNLDTAAIRRWVAPYDGEVSIGGEFALSRQGGDGVRARIISSRKGLLGEWTVGEQPAKTLVEKHSVKRGEILDFAVDCVGHPSRDAYRWAPTLRLLIRAEDAPTDVQTVWDSQADFKAPPPPKLQPLEQMAHALLMTNEFLFVD